MEFKQLTIHNANAYKVMLDNKQFAYVEEQEHYSFMRIEHEPNLIVGEYYLMAFNPKKIQFEEIFENDVTGFYFGDVLAYSHDYGKTWTEVE